LGFWSTNAEDLVFSVFEVQIPEHYK
jgi:hypothetical protein